MKTRAALVFILITGTVAYAWGARRLSDSWTDNPTKRIGGIRLAQAQNVLTTPLSYLYVGEDGNIKGGFIYKRDLEFLMQHQSELPGRILGLPLNVTELQDRESTILGESLLFFGAGAVLLLAGLLPRKAFRSAVPVIAGALLWWVVAFVNVLVATPSPAKYLASLGAFVVVVLGRSKRGSLDKTLKENGNGS